MCSTHTSFLQKDVEDGIIGYVQFWPYGNSSCCLWKFYMTTFQSTQHHLQLLCLFCALYLVLIVLEPDVQANHVSLSSLYRTRELISLTNTLCLHDVQNCIVLSGQAFFAIYLSPSLRFGVLLQYCLNIRS
jgi:hypothetical protein